MVPLIVPFVVLMSLANPSAKSMSPLMVPELKRKNLPLDLNASLPAPVFVTMPRFVRELVAPPNAMV
jgi:hypothetical protein